MGGNGGDGGRKTDSGAIWGSDTSSERAEISEREMSSSSGSWSKSASSSARDSSSESSHCASEAVSVFSMEP